MLVTVCGSRIIVRQWSLVQQIHNKLYLHFPDVHVCICMCNIMYRRVCIRVCDKHICNYEYFSILPLQKWCSLRFGAKSKEISSSVIYSLQADKIKASRSKIDLVFCVLKMGWHK